MAVNTEGIKQRKTAVQPNAKSAPCTEKQPKVKKQDNHPAGPVKHGGAMQAFRIFLFGSYFTFCCLL